ncbi:MAG: TraR/DksA C4-type zinc finger protein [Sphingorhabdus sp.]
MTDTSPVRAELQQRLADLIARAGRIEAEITVPLNADSEDQATEMSDDDALTSEDELVMREIATVRAAIGRIDVGHYGQCLSCGADIAPARLAAMPEATLCTDCM